jgi:hypothetical protein
MTDYADAKNPQYWPYPEKVMGFATHPPELNESPDTTVPAYRAAWFPTDADIPVVKPPLDLFCDRSDDCTPGAKIKLSMIPTAENKAEGDRLGQMFGVCNVPTATYDGGTKQLVSNGGPFLTVPLLGDTPKSFYVC